METNKILEEFGRPRVLLPVIHACSYEQVRDQADVARDGGADGVFVINQGGLEPLETVVAANAIAEKYPEWFVGVNLLGEYLPETTALLREWPRIRGLWCDDAQPFLWSTQRRNTRLVYFGGVAFKGQVEVEPAMWGPQAVAASLLGVDVVTTSGPRTGAAAPAVKLNAFRNALGTGHALGVASGVTPENVAAYLPSTNAFLVASGIEREFGVFDPKRLEQLARLIHQGPVS